MKRILVVEDNDDYRKLIVNELIRSDFNVDHADSPIKGLEMLALNYYDLVISDLNLPVMSGVTFTESVKNISPSTICIILTGDPDESSELESIDNNIDLYIEKNKSMSVILKYINKLIHDLGEDLKQDRILISRVEKIEMNISEHTATKDGVVLDLTPKEFEILKIFLTNKNKVISREQFVDLAWEEPAEVIGERLVDAHIKKLRDKINSISIMTVRGYGYRWNEAE